MDGDIGLSLGSARQDRSPSRNYMRQPSYNPSFDPGQSAGTHPSFPTLRHQDTSPYSAGGGLSSHYSLHGDMASDCPRLLYSSSPEAHTNRCMFLDQNSGSINGAISQILSEVRLLSARMIKLETEVQRTRTVKQCFEELEGMGAQLSALKNAVAESNVTCVKKAGGTSRGIVNDHPSLKVSWCRICL